MHILTTLNYFPFQHIYGSALSVNPNKTLVVITLLIMTAFKKKSIKSIVNGKGKMSPSVMSVLWGGQELRK